ncbi:MAG: MiaB/RimO family radical SAM methylthiotransferase [Bacteroidales bacterium]|jgi:tRNA-2-methylthio-N6-dimethylallyladenosine synthase|nr:MiaB/RimO family radical SAM methylthiotransferase [Bacteroidales bacterium]MDG1901185.1 MiaB/RimO family radical SAM methylthiotransferase [Bacteroidales bacterium]MDG2080317.1 MiaB/RimO family radical SAM methylthiotransferase [Bacteroidales bacterium]
MKYHIVQLGCQMNISDGERVQKVLEDVGYVHTDNPESANLIGVIACSVRQKGIDKVYSMVNTWNKWKNNRNLITFVSGCVLPSDKEKFLKLFDMVFTMSQLPELPEMINHYGIVTPAGLMGNENIQVEQEFTDNSPQLGGFRINEAQIPSSSTLVEKKPEDIKEFWNIEPKYGSNVEAYIPIQNGCDKFCTFCAVPYTRGREVSRPSEEIMNEVKTLVEKGTKSITILGQNVNSYGYDKKGSEITFAQLLEKIGEYGNQSNKEFWIYFTSPHPRDMSDDVIEMVAKYKCLAKQIHLPVQSGDDKLLIKMNRNHSMLKYREIVSTIRRLIPEATLFTDIIVGFTGETEKEFENTMKIMEEFKYNMAYIAQYSPRPGATSSRWDDDVPKEVKKERFHRLTKELTKYSRKHNNDIIGKTLRVLVRGRDRKEGYLSALTEGRIVTRFASNDATLIGEFVDIKITSAASLSVEGELLKN